MKKVLGLLAVGVVACAGVYMYMRADTVSASLLVKADGAQSVDVERSLAALDRRVRDLSAQVQALQSAAGKPVAPGERPQGDNGQRRQDWQNGRNVERTPEEITAMRERMQEMEKQREKQREERDNERIRAAGLTPERVASINRRMEELQVAAQKAQFEAQQSGQRVEGTNIQASLRKELGDTEYERYLKATGRPTQVRVMDVYATSNAERSGLKAGDEIVSYNGKRVFEPRDLTSLSSQAAAGGSVTVEVKRNGQTMQVSVPAGPLGVQAGSGGGGGRQDRGGQGGFGGGGPGGGGFRGGRPGG